MREILEFTRITLKQSTRLRSFYSAFVITLVSLIGLFVIYSFTMFEIPRILASYVLSCTNFIVLLMVFLTLFSLLQYDIDRKTLQYVIALPLRRRDYIVGRYLGIMFFSIIIAYGIILLFYPFLILLMKQRPDAPFSVVRYFTYPVFLLAEVSLIVSFALLFTTLSTKSIISIISTVGVYLIGHSLDEVKEFLLGGYAQEIPLFSKILVKGAWYVFPNLSLFDVKLRMVYNLQFSFKEALMIITYGIVYTIAILVITCALFERKEIL